MQFHGHGWQSRSEEQTETDRQGQDLCNAEGEKRETVANTAEAPTRRSVIGIAARRSGSCSSLVARRPLIADRRSYLGR